MSENIKDTTEVMKECIYEYSMYVNEERAIPDIRDGLKPVARRSIIGMHSKGFTHNNSYVKGARCVGEVLGNLHPHGDSSVWGSMTGMSQHWNMNIPLIDASGNNGNISGASPAAMRYLEIKLSKACELLYNDLKYATVDLEDNYTAEIKVPTVLPTRIPLLLINGTQGIGMGMASSMPGHNYHDSIKLCMEYNLNRNMTLEEMVSIIKAPDFPGGGVINGTEKLMKAYETGKGSVSVQGIIEKEFVKGRWDLHVTCIPQGIGLKYDHDTFIKDLYTLVDEDKLRLYEGIKNTTGKNGVKITIPLHRSEDPNRVEQLIFKSTRLRTNFTINNTVLIDKVPTTVGLKDIVKYFINFREEVIYRRSYDMHNKLTSDLEIQNGLVVVFNNLDYVIDTIRKSESDKVIIEKFMSKLKLTEKQIKYILDVQLKRLKKIEKDAILNNIKKIETELKRLSKIISSKSNKYITSIIDEELKEALTYKKDTGRKCKINRTSASSDIIDTLKEEDRLIIFTKGGRIKNLDSKFEVQSRGGSGPTITSSSEDEAEFILSTKNTSKLLCFTNTGKVFAKDVFRLETTSKHAKGRFIKTEFDTRDDEIIYVKDIPRNFDIKNKYLVFMTRNGTIKITSYDEYDNINANGKKAINLNANDSLVSVEIWDKKEFENYIITTKNGNSIKINLKNVTVTSRVSSGVKGIGLNVDDEVISGIVIKNKYLYFIDKYGKIKKVEEHEFNLQSRGGKGVNSGKNIASVISSNELIPNISVFTKNGKCITINKKSIKSTSRTSMGVKAIRLQDKDEVLKMIQI